MQNHSQLSAAATGESVFIWLEGKSLDASGQNLAFELSKFSLFFFVPVWSSHETSVGYSEEFAHTTPAGKKVLEAFGTFAFVPKSLRNEKHKLRKRKCFTHILEG